MLNGVTRVVREGGGGGGGVWGGEGGGGAGGGGCSPKGLFYSFYCFGAYCPES